MSNTPISIDTDEQKVSYGFGLQFGQQLLKNTFAGLDANVVAQGIKDILEENEIKVSESELNDAYGSVQRVIAEGQEKQAKQMIALGKTFLDENAKRDGVSVTDSGLQYEILEAGTGSKPEASATVKVHYQGTFMDGSVFDSSIERGEPAEFGVTQVIPGWTEALQLMESGAKWRLVIPSDLAYGDAGAPPSIPGGAVLVFEVHLIDII